MVQKCGAIGPISRTAGGSTLNAPILNIPSSPPCDRAGSRFSAYDDRGQRRGKDYRS